ncbi:universal stress protein [Halococcus thailandensis]|uniref:Universal stress protein n=1 Tax=Halococcus thailandensis JCM 13552 TaxID=1227457 RepID=M0NE73_9EURY|nr:universal stress protein [Halococcus thailandensis]EMA56141.1 universal stress protein [Halococcus thailandensis JCM 13552]
MYDRLLFPSDGSEITSSVFKYTLEVASEHDAEVHIVNVADSTPDTGTNVNELENKGEQIVLETAKQAEGREISIVSNVLQGQPHELIVEYGEQFDIDLIVMPNHGKEDLERFLLGGVTERVINHSDIPILTVNPSVSHDYSYPTRDVLVPIDSSQGADRALKEGINLANTTGATLHLLHVVEMATMEFDVRSEVSDEQLKKLGNETITKGVEAANTASVPSVTSSIVYGRPHREIHSYIKANDIGLVTIGTHGQTDFSQYTLGRVSSNIVRTSPVPVLMVRQPASDETYSLHEDNSNDTN